MPELIPLHTVEEHANSIARYLPSGPLFDSAVIQDTNLYNLLLGASYVLLETDELINLVSSEYDIRYTTQLIDEWETFVGIPDACFTKTGTLQQRRDRVLIKLASLGVQTVADFKALALLFGIEVNIESGSVHGVFPMEFPVVFYPSAKVARFTMVVNFSVSGSGTFPLPFPYPFGDPNIALMKCLFQKLKPANVVLSYNPY